MYFIIFGYPFNKYKEINIEQNSVNEKYISIPYAIKEIIENNKNKISDNLYEFFIDMNFLFIKFNLNCNLDYNDIKNMKYNDNDIEKDEDKFIMEQSHFDSLKKYFGYVRRIFPGHDGKMDNDDFLFIKKFLKYNKFL